MTNRECVNCVMDETDPDILFNEKGICSYCLEFQSSKLSIHLPLEARERELSRILNSVRQTSNNREYNCIVGLSGGLDSSFLVYKMANWGLKPLIVHVDAGWNSEIAVSNISAVVKYSGFDLKTQVVDWEEMKDLQVAYLRSGMSNLDVPQDHIFTSLLYETALKHKIKHVFSGGNIATEFVFPKNWHRSAMDATNLCAINSRFGEKPLSNYKTTSFYKYYLKYPFFDRIKTYRPLDLIDYSPYKASLELRSEIGWKEYERKHGESFFTKIFQNYILPERYGYDKRKPHLSSLILSGVISREDAKKKLAKPLYDQISLERDIDYLCKKLGISSMIFNEMMNLPLRRNDEFKNWDFSYNLIKEAQKIFSKLFNLKLRWYS